MNVINELKFKAFHSGNRVNLFIAINVIIFLVVSLLSVFEKLFLNQNAVDAFVMEYLAVHSYLPKLLIRPWSLFTYLFLHDGVFHILFNMLWLYWLGNIFQEYLKSAKFTFVYITGGIFGALLYILLYNILPFYEPSVINSAAIGASAAVMAIVAGTATLLPNYTIALMFIGPVRLVWIALIYFVIDLLNLTGANAGGHIAHIGGAIFGFAYIKSLQNGMDWSKPFTSLFKKKSKLKVVSKQTFKSPSNVPDQKEIDRILDKISKSGYDKLSKQEKEQLFKASNNNESN